MHVLQFGLFFLGVALLVIGYRKSNRDLLLAAALLLFTPGAIDSFASGFLAGFRDARADALSAPTAPSK